MKRILFGVLLAMAVGAVAADERQSCEAASGAWRSGVVLQGPKFVHGQFRKGIELSHTHLKVRADQDGQVYDVAIDNVFASGYRPGQPVVPSPIDSIRAGDHLSMCGQLYDRGVGIHFVHTNCGESPAPNHPDGWLRVVDRSGRPGDNLESSTNYCPLFGHGRRRR